MKGMPMKSLAGFIFSLVLATLGIAPAAADRTGPATVTFSVPIALSSPIVPANVPGNVYCEVRDAGGSVINSAYSAPPFQLASPPQSMTVTVGIPAGQTAKSYYCALMINVGNQSQFLENWLKGADGQKWLSDNNLTVSNVFASSKGSL